jgi:hypothetical protein
MNANYEFQQDFLQNEDQFNDPFFKRFQLRKNTEPLKLSDEISKDYWFPTFYGDVTCAIAIFFCDYKAAVDLMPHASFVPVKATLGRAFVILSCYEYKNVLNIPGYNEIAMTIPILHGGGFNPPLLPMVMKSFQNFGFYVFSMPVTSHENTKRGRNIWGLPKVTEDIHISVKDGYCTTRAKDEDGKTYFNLTVPTEGKKQHFDETGNLYSILMKEILKSETNFKGDFAVNKNPSLLWRRDIKTDPVLELGDSPRAEILKGLKLTNAAFQFRFCASMNSCFDLAHERMPR